MSRSLAVSRGLAVNRSLARRLPGSDITRIPDKPEPSRTGYQWNVPDAVLTLGRRTFAHQLADSVREARVLIGWTQRELAERARTSQTMVWRVETVRCDRLDLAVVERLLAALGIRASLALDARHLADRQRQRDAVHARIVGYVARRLERAGWHTALEVPLGDGIPRGWIDLLAYREADGSLLIDETKTEIPDFGGLGRSLAFYQREAWAAAARLGWRARRSVVLVTALDTSALAARLVANRDVVIRMFPASVTDLAPWLANAGMRPPDGWAMGTVDPAARGTTWLHQTVLGTRRRRPAYEDYAAAALRLRGGQRP